MDGRDGIFGRRGKETEMAGGKEPKGRVASENRPIDRSVNRKDVEWQIRSQVIERLARSGNQTGKSARRIARFIYQQSVFPLKPKQA